MEEGLEAAARPVHREELTLLTYKASRTFVSNSKEDAETNGWKTQRGQSGGANLLPAKFGSARWFTTRIVRNVTVIDPSVVGECQERHEFAEQWDDPELYHIEHFLYLLRDVWFDDVGDLSEKDQKAVFETAKELCEIIGQSGNSLLFSCYWLMNMIAEEKYGRKHDSALDFLKGSSEKNPSEYWAWQESMTKLNLYCHVKLANAPLPTRKIGRRIYIRPNAFKH